MFKRLTPSTLFKEIILLFLALIIWSINKDVRKFVYLESTTSIRFYELKHEFYDNGEPNNLFASEEIVAESFITNPCVTHYYILGFNISNKIWDTDIHNGSQIYNTKRICETRSIAPSLGSYYIPTEPDVYTEYGINKEAFVKDTFKWNPPSELEIIQFMQKVDPNLAKRITRVRLSK